jgi:peptidoglycan/LPS O-acetylase OafA/YrhL
MNRATSTYLDATRFLAACFIFLHHLNDWSGKAIPVFAPMQSQAVIVFFVLSGYVIGFVVDVKEKQLADYTISRLSRIYSVALPALVATFMLEIIGSLVVPASYGAFSSLSFSDLGLQFAAGLLFLNEVWGHHISVGSNNPFWSLGYEVPYYIAFAGYTFVPGKWKWVLPLVVLAAYGPRVAVLAPVWLLGFASYRIASRERLTSMAGWWLLIGSTIAWIAFYAGIYVGVVPSTVVPVYWHRWELAEDYLVGALFAANIIGFHAVSAFFLPLTERCRRPVHWVAGATFTLYLFHYPISKFLRSVLPWQMNRPADMVGLTLVVFVLIFAVAEVTERRKEDYRRAFSRLLPGRFFHGVAWVDRAKSTQP